MIWEASLPPPRRLYLQESVDIHGESQWAATIDSDGSSSDTLIPSILSICHESRDCFTREAGYSIFGFGLTKPIYMNHSKDQLWFRGLN